MADSYIKDPSAELDYTVDWATWLADGETISSHEEIVPEGLTQPQGASESAGVVTIWLSGGTVGAVYSVTSRITTSLGRTDDRSIRIRVEER